MSPDKLGRSRAWRTPFLVLTLFGAGTAGLGWLSLRGWSLSVKIDRREAPSASQGRTVPLAAPMLLLLAASGAALTLCCRGRAARIERRERELEGRALKRRFEALWAQANDIVLVLGKDGRIIQANDRAVEGYGHSRDELLRLHIADVHAPEAVAACKEGWERTRLEGCLRADALHRRKDGSTFPVELSSRMVDAGGEPFAVVVCRDISQRRRDEAARAESEEVFRTVFHTSPDAISITRLSDGAYVAINESFTRMAGWEERDVLGRTSLDLGIWVEPGARARLTEGLRAKGVVENLEAEFRCRDGRILSGLMSARVIAVGGEPSLLSVTREVTDWKRAQEERKRLEEQLRQAQKMEAIGRLAGGVAHDFNNLVTVILGNVGAVRAGLPDCDKRAQALDDVEDAARRAAALTRQLLAFGRKQAVEPQPLRLAPLVQDLRRMLDRLLGEDVQLSIAAGAETGMVVADPGQVEQVVMNLVVNSRAAMPTGGRLQIEISEAEVTRGHPRLPAGRYTVLAVTDTGQGMTAEVQAHIFEPFFTTKPAGEGGGLGLSTVYGIVQQHGGMVELETALGAGTTFRVWFPQSDPPFDRKAPAGEKTPVPGRETVLLVEDDAAVREVTRGFLAHLGYRVLSAQDAEEAVRLAEHHPGAIDLLLTDVVLKGPSGRDVAARLRATRHGIRVLYMSGYPRDTLALRGPGDLGALVPKPFTLHGLSRAVREELDRAVAVDPTVQGRGAKRSPSRQLVGP